MSVRAKKHLGQHFLIDKNICRKIADSVVVSENSEKINCLEVGPGTGNLSVFLNENSKLNLKLIDVDKESVDYLLANFPEFHDRVVYGDFLKISINEIFKSSFILVGNLPYNISSQIFFKILEYRDIIPQSVVMIQKEVAQRISTKSGSKLYGILSVLLQAFYDIEYLFTVPPSVFSPPPNVQSAVIRLIRNSTKELNCNEELFFRIIKSSFNQRRKTIRNSLRSFLPEAKRGSEFYLLSKRPEQLSVNEFIELVNFVDS